MVQYCYGFFYRLQAQSTAYSTVISALSGVVLTAMFIACAAYVAAGTCISAILDLRFIAINKRRNFIITTVVRLFKKVNYISVHSALLYHYCFV